MTHTHNQIFHGKHGTERKTAQIKKFSLPYDETEHLCRYSMMTGSMIKWFGGCENE